MEACVGSIMTMPSNRKPIERPQRARISAEVLEFFLELERMPRRQRDSQVFKDGEHELARRLNLVSEFWSGNSVLDRDQGPCWLPSLIAHHDWYRLREIREQLLAATGRYRLGSATKTSSTQCATPSWPLTGSKTFGGRLDPAGGRVHSLLVKSDDHGDRRAARRPCRRRRSRDGQPRPVSGLSQGLAGCLAAGWRRQHGSAGNKWRYE
jgi:hypothetical protein